MLIIVRQPIRHQYVVRDTILKIKVFGPTSHRECDIFMRNAREEKKTMAKVTLFKTPMFMQNPSSKAVFLILGKTNQGSHSGFILGDDDDMQRKVGHHSDMWSRDLVPLKGNFTMFNSPMHDEFPKLMVAASGLSLFLITAQNKTSKHNNLSGIRLASTTDHKIGQQSDTWWDLEDVNSSVDLFNT